jgi:predicted HicB family RNase H-like nuclease
MNNVLAYKGFTGTVEYSAKDRIFWGGIAFINDTVLFEGENVRELEKNFKEAVKHYIETCKEIGKEPQKPFKGHFPTRIKPDLHKKAALIALQKKISLNKFVEQAIKHEIESSGT